MPEAVAAWVADYYAFEVIGATVTTAAAIETAVYVAATVAISAAAQSVFSSGQGGTSAARVLNTTVRQSAAPRRLIYGTVKAGGVLVYAAQSTDGTYADLVTYLGEGPIQGLADSTWWVGDTLASDSKFTGLLDLTIYTGAPGQTASAALIAASGGEWTSAHVGNGVAYAHTRYQFDRNAFPQGLVFPAFMVRGRQLYDPRTATTAHSSNPALVMLDYIRSAYGYAAPDAWIDFDSFAAAAAVCDEVVDSIDPANVVDGTPGKVLRYTCNAVFETAAGPSVTVATIEQCCAGKLIFSGGKYRFFAGAYRAPTGPTFTGEYLRSAPTYRTHASRQQRINIARGTYREPLQDWQQIDYQPQTLSAAVVAEDGEIVQSIDMPAVTNGATAQRLAKLAMLQARSAVPMVLPCNWSAFQWRLWDTLTIDLPEAGASGVWLITEYTFAEGGGIDLTVVPHNAADYAWTPATDEHLVPVVTKPSFNSVPPTVAGLAVSGAPYVTGSWDSGAVIALSASWTATAWAFLRHYEVQTKPSADTDWSAGVAVYLPSWYTVTVAVGTEYDVRVRVVATDDRVGEWTTVTNVLVLNDATPPGPPTSLSATGAGTHTVGWTTPTDTDFSRVRVYANSVDDAPSATQIAEIFGLPGTAYTTTHTPGATTWYWVEAVDRTGNASARTAAGSAT